MCDRGVKPLLPLANGNVAEFVRHLLRQGKDLRACRTGRLKHIGALGRRVLP